jgi:short-subunit dehydrogenase
MTPSRKHTFFITGASSGLGLAIALEALQLGHKVIGTARNTGKANVQHPEYAQLGGEWLQLDLTDPNAREITRLKVEEKNVDILVNNAGYGIYGALEDMRCAFPGVAFFPYFINLITHFLQRARDPRPDGNQFFWHAQGH